MLESQMIYQIVDSLEEMNSKLNRVIELLECNGSHSVEDKAFFSETETLDVIKLLSLPDHLRRTATTLFEIGPATADEIARKTSKERAVESNYLNQLVRMKHVKKYREGRKVYFCTNESIKSSNSNCNIAFK